MIQIQNLLNNSILKYCFSYTFNFAERLLQLRVAGIMMYSFLYRSPPRLRYFVETSPLDPQVVHPLPFRHFTILSPSFVHPPIGPQFVSYRTWLCQYQSSSLPGT